jgi:hypothetical protein
MYKNLQQRFLDPDMTMMCKVRLLALFLLTCDGVKDEMRRKLIEIGRIDSASENAMANLPLLGAPILKDKSYVSRSTLTKKDSVNEVVMIPTRFIPVAKEKMYHELEGILSTSDYPYLVEPPPGEERPTRAKNIGSGFGLGSSKYISLCPVVVVPLILYIIFPCYSQFCSGRC